MLDVSAVVSLKSAAVTVLNKSIVDSTNSIIVTCFLLIMNPSS